MKKGIDAHLNQKFLESFAIEIFQEIASVPIIPCFENLIVDFHLYCFILQWSMYFHVSLSYSNFNIKEALFHKWTSPSIKRN